MSSGLQIAYHYELVGTKLAVYNPETRESLVRAKVVEFKGENQQSLFVSYARDHRSGWCVIVATGSIDGAFTNFWIMRTRREVNCSEPLFVDRASHISVTPELLFDLLLENAPPA